MYNPYSLLGKTVLVTGASSGIGRATAIECSRMGARVVLAARNLGRLQETFSLLDGDGHSVLEMDLSQMDTIKDWVETLPLLDGVVSNAGINVMNPIAFMKETDIEAIFQVNTFAPMLLLKQLQKSRKIVKGASVVFTSSLAGVGAAAVGNAIYTASKGALSAFIKVAALELASRKIRVNAVCPGMTQTQMIYDKSVQEEDLKKDMERYPLGRYGHPNDIAWAIIYLLSDASSWVTGTNLVIDGGLTVR